MNVQIRLQRMFRCVVAASVGVGAVFVAPSASAAEGSASQVLTGLLVASEGSVAGYDRSLFGGWIDADGDSCNTRQEVLLAESLKQPVIGPGCSVSGLWRSFLDNVEWRNASRLDVDHHVALEEAWQSGASQWSADQRRSFANDLDYFGSLNAVTDTVNSSKGSGDPAEWMPPFAAASCNYVTMWVLTKHRWRLSVDPAKRALFKAA